MRAIYSKQFLLKNKTFAHKTVIYQDTDKKIVVKEPQYEQARAHLEEVCKSRAKMLEAYPRSEINSVRMKDGCLFSEFEENCTPLMDFYVKAVKSRDRAAFFALLDRHAEIVTPNNGGAVFSSSAGFEQLFGKEAAGRFAGEDAFGGVSFELGCGNILLRGGDLSKPVLVDFDVFYDFPVPKSLLYYSIVQLIYLTIPDLGEVVPFEEAVSHILRRYGIRRSAELLQKTFDGYISSVFSEEDGFRSSDVYYKNYAVYSNNIPLVPSVDGRIFAAFYFDTGSGFNASKTLSFGFEPKDGRIIQSISLPSGTKTLRFDPVENAGCVLRNLEVMSAGGVMRYNTHNGFAGDNGSLLFPHFDPQIMFDIPDGVTSVALKCDVAVFEDYALFSLLGDYRKNIADCEDLAAQRQNLLLTRDELSETVGRLSAERDGLNANLADLAQAKAAEVASLNARLEDVQTTLAIRTDALKISGERFAALEAESDRLRENLEESLSEAFGEQQALKAQRDELNGRLAELTAERDHYVLHYNAAIVQREALTMEKTALVQEAGRYRHLYEEIRHAFFWKLSAPARVILNALKKFLKAFPLTRYPYLFLMYWKNLGLKATLQVIKNRRERKSAAASPALQTTAAGTLSLAYESEYQTDTDFSEYTPDVKTLAFYLPQFHAIPENDEWWGKGFTEWSNTRKSLPKFDGHYQPREPHDDFGYYDLTDVNVIKKQAALARRHGLYGFCFYLYWFSGRRLLEKPLDILIAHPEIDINFCLCWANENWTRTWDGLEKNVLIGQNYSEEDPVNFIDDMKKYLTDKRYIRIKGKPVIIVYNPGHIQNIERFFTSMRRQAKNNGIGEILIWTCQTMFNTAETLKISHLIDAEAQFPPHNIDSTRENIGIKGVDLGGRTAGLMDYGNLAEDFVNNIEASHRDEKIPLYHAAMMGWDNGARRDNGFSTFCRFNLKSFYNWVRAIKADALGKFKPEEAFIFINAWNEWCEGTYLEPDKKYGYANINTLSKAICDIPFDGGVKVVTDNQAAAAPAEASASATPAIAVQVHLFYTDLVGEIIENLNFIPYPFDCYISTDTDSKAKTIKKEFAENCKAVNVYVSRVENRGRDIAPFIRQMSPVIDRYDYICHIHTKKSLTVDWGDCWRKYLYKHLFGSREYLTALFGEFAENPKLGVVFPDTYPALKRFAEWGSNEPLVQQLFDRLGVRAAFDNNAVFPVGNMFWARTSAVRRMFTSNITNKDFQEEDGQTNLTLAHAIERAWVYLARYEGYEHRKLFNNTAPAVTVSNKHKNLLLFAHYDRDNIMSDDDVKYLKSLTDISDNIVFITNSKLSESELAKAKKYAVKTLCRDNSGYDFGMWRDAILSYKAAELEQYDNLILVNNSCYGPYHSLSHVFDEMTQRKDDFWGLSLFPYLADGSFINEPHINEHLQSFFMTFTKKAFTHRSFVEFWRNLKVYNELNAVIKNCENVLTKVLSDAGLTYSAYVRECGTLCEWLGNYSLPYEYPYQMLLAGLPLLKKKYKDHADKDEQTAAEFFARQARDRAGA